MASIDRNGSGELSGTSIASMPASNTARPTALASCGAQAAQDGDDAALEFWPGRAHALALAAPSNAKLRRAASSRPLRTALLGIDLRHGVAGPRQRLGVEIAEQAGSDQHDIGPGVGKLRASPTRARCRSAGRTVPPRQHPRLHVEQQRRGADAEQLRDGVARMRQSVIEPVAEDRIVGRDLCRVWRRARGAGSNASTAPRTVRRSAMSANCVTTPSTMPHPFAMRAGHADQQVGTVQAGNAGKLRFLAAHHVGALALALCDAGNDAHVARALRQQRSHRRGSSSNRAGVAT